MLNIRSGQSYSACLHLGHTFILLLRQSEEPVPVSVESCGISELIDPEPKSGLRELTDLEALFSLQELIDPASESHLQETTDPESESRSRTDRSGVRIGISVFRELIDPKTILFPRT